MLYLGRGSSVTQCPLCHRFTPSWHESAGVLMAMRAVVRPSVVKIVDAFAAATRARSRRTTYKPLKAQSNLEFSGV
jgi:hypothetical protein